MGRRTLDDRFHETTQLHLGLSIHGMRPFRTSHMIRTLETLWKRSTSVCNRSAALCSSPLRSLYCNVRIVHVGQVLQGLVTALMKRPSPDCPGYGRECLRAGGGHEAVRGKNTLPHRFPRSETETEKIERFVREVTTPVRILAVDDSCLLRMQLCLCGAGLNILPLSFCQSR